MASVDLSTAFGKLLKLKREAAHLSQEELAIRAELTRNYISLLERGLRNPTLNTLAMLAKALRTSLLDLVRDLSD